VYVSQDLQTDVTHDHNTFVYIGTTSNKRAIKHTHPASEKTRSKWKLMSVCESAFAAPVCTLHAEAWKQLPGCPAENVAASRRRRGNGSGNDASPTLVPQQTTQPEEER
jgi:hypothetical protein